MDYTLKIIKIGYTGNRKIISFSPKSLKKSFLILNLLYKEGYILSYYYNKLKIKKKINVVLNYTQFFLPVLLIFKNFNTKNSTLYLKYKDLCLFNEFNCLLILSTIYGIKTHYESLLLKIGGKLLFFLR